MPACGARPSPLSRSRTSPAQRARVKRRDGNRCQRCGSPGTPGNPLQVRHRTRVADGGSHADSNLVTLCARCHRTISA
ncbi:MAG: HNH endonuclease [Gaiellaceae bacterium]